MCAAILLKFRYDEMSVAQKLIISILYAGHCGMQVRKTMCITLMYVYTFSYIGLQEVAEAMPFSVPQDYLETSKATRTTP